MAQSDLGIAWHRFKTFRGVFLVSMLVLFAAWACLEAAVVALQGWGAVPNVALHVAFLVVFSGLMVGLHRMALQVVDGHLPRLKDLTGFLWRGPTLLLAASLYSVAVAFGLVLLGVPGVYVAVRYSLFGPAIAAGESSAIEALRDAGALSRGRWFLVCRFVVGVVALNIAGAALLGLGLFFSFPVSVLATASLFRTLQHAALSEAG